MELSSGVKSAKWWLVENSLLSYYITVGFHALSPKVFYVTC